MDYSGPSSVVDIEADLALSDEEEQALQNWPYLPTSKHQQPTGGMASSQPHRLSSTSSKRPIDLGSDASSTSASPVAKTHKTDKDSVQLAASDRPLPRPLPPLPPASPLLPSAAPAFAPREDYVKLGFQDNPSCEVKLRWLTEVNKAFRLDRELAEVKMSSVTSRFVYISRRRKDIIDSVTSGEFLSLRCVIQDSLERPRKFPTYLVTRYPTAIDPSLAKALQGVHTARRFLQDGEPINRIVITWSLPEPPPSVVEFPFLPCLPPCELRRMKDEKPWCYKCWGIGHISRYCSASARCAWCAADHDTRSCPHSVPASSTAAAAGDAAPGSSSLRQPDTSQWKCVRCKMPGVNVWHGCTKRSPATSTGHAPPPPPPPAPSSPRPTDSADIIALRKSVATLESRCTALTARFDTIDARIDSMIAQQTATANTLASLVESHQVVITTITTLTDKLEKVASHLEKLTGVQPRSSSSSAPPGSALSTSALRPNKTKHR